MTLLFLKDGKNKHVIQIGNAKPFNFLTKGFGKSNLKMFT